MDTRDTGRMNPAPESPDAARKPVPVGHVDILDALAFINVSEGQQIEQGQALYAATTITRLTAERDAALRDAERWRALYRRAVNEANGLTNYVEDRPELRSAERKLAAIEAEARAALSAQERGNV